MAIQGRAALVGWFDHEDEADMNEWQAREHVLERVGIPGFLRHRRYASPDAHPRHFTLIETEDVASLSSPVYLERLNNPTEWSRRASRGLSNMRRSLCRLTATVGEVDGGTVATMEVDPADRSSLREWLETDAFPRLVSRGGVYAVHLFEADSDASRIETTEKKLRAPDTIVEWAVVVEGLDPASVSDAVGEVLTADLLQSHGAESVSQPQVYRLSFAATSG